MKSFIQKSIKPKVISRFTLIKSFIQKAIKAKVISGFILIKSFIQKSINPKVISSFTLIKSYIQRSIRPRVILGIIRIKSFIQRSIKVKVILSIALIIGFITLVGLIYFPQKFKSVEIQAMSDKINTISKIASFNVGFGMYFNDRDAVAEQLEPILNIPYISYIVVENQKDSIFYSVNFLHAEEKMYTQIETEFISEDGSIYKIKTPIIFNYEQLGNIYIGYSLEMINERIGQIQNQIVGISLILFLLGVTAAYFFADHILEPLLKIVNVSREITFGNLKTRVLVSSKDEIGYLAESFNEMVDKLDNAQEELERRVEERTKELKTALISLKKAKEEAEKSDQLKTEFLGQMSHEIRTPLNVFLSFASLVKDEITKKKNKELESEFDVMVSASDRLIRTIELMLNFSEVQSNSYVCSNKQIDIYSEILKVLVEEYSKTAAEKGLDIILAERKVTEYIYADKFTVTQIFKNIIENGIKYTKEGKVEIILKSHKNNKLSITVADTGIGIAEEYMESLFEPFRQEEQGYTRKYDGNGLGLALVKKYCDLNKADLNIKSKKGKGTKIIVTFNKDA